MLWGLGCSVVASRKSSNGYGVMAENGASASSGVRPRWSQDPREVGV